MTPPTKGRRTTKESVIARDGTPISVQTIHYPDAEGRMELKKIVLRFNGAFDLTEAHRALQTVFDGTRY